MNTTRLERIARAFLAACNGRDPNNVDIVKLLPAIKRAVPDATIKEIDAAMRWASECDLRAEND